MGAVGRGQAVPENNANTPTGTDGKARRRCLHLKNSVLATTSIIDPLASWTCAAKGGQGGRVGAAYPTSRTHSIPTRSSRPPGNESTLSPAGGRLGKDHMSNWIRGKRRHFTPKGRPTDRSRPKRNRLRRRFPAFKHARDQSGLPTGRHLTRPPPPPRPPSPESIPPSAPGPPADRPQAPTPAFPGPGRYLVGGPGGRRQEAAHR